MITAETMQGRTSNVVRVFYLYSDFRVRVDDNSPVHFDFDVRRVDTQGMRWILTFRVCAMDRRNRLIIFEHKWAHTYIQTVQRDEVIQELIEKFAEPLNAVPGRLEVK